MAEIAERISRATGKPFTPGPVAPSYPNVNYAWYSVGVLVVAYTFSFIDRQILSLLVGPMRRDLQITDTEVSLLQGFIFAIFYTLFGLPIGRMVDSRSRVTIISLGIFFWSLMTGLCGVARVYWQLLLFRTGVGVGEAALSPAAYSLIADSFPPKRIGLALGIYSMGIYIGAGLALVIGAEVVRLVSQGGNVSVPLLGDVYTWQVVFFVVGLPGVLVAIWARTLREPQRHGVKMAVEGATEASSVSLSETIGYIMRNAPAFLCMTLLSSFNSLASYAAGAWVPTFFVRTYGWSVVDAGRWYGWETIIFGVSGVLAGGVAGDFMRSRGFRSGRIMVMTVGSALMLPCAALFPLLGDANSALLLLAPSIFFSTVVFGTAPSALQEMMPNQMRGVASALSLFILNLIGLGLGPTAVALVTDYVFHDDKMLRYSLAYVSIATLIVSVLFGLAALRPYARSLETVERWKAQHVGY
jgi:MFS family permease